MGAIVQECVPLCLQKLSIKERKWTSCNHNLPSNMGRRQSQRKSPLPHNTSSWQDNNHFTEKRSQQRRKNNANIPSTKCTSLQTSAQGTAADSVCRVALPVGERREVQRPPCRQREHSRGPARSKHGAAVHPPCRLSDSSPAPPGSQGPKQDPGKLCDPGKDTDSDRDLSDTERLPASPSSPASSTIPPQLDLRPEVITPDNLPPDPCRPRGRGGPGTSSYPFPDFLPPPFNTWSLAQLASFYHTESQRSPRPRPSDPLERFLDRLLQLEWRRMQTAQQEEEEGGAGHASTHAARPAVRLSCPKSILQCQRAFPLTFLSSLAIDSALLSGCSCSQCRQRYNQAASHMSSLSASMGGARRCRCPSAHARPAFLAEHVPVHPLPKRSHSETRARGSAERGPSKTRGRLPLSPAGGNHNSHQRRMQALGNLRHPASSGPPTETPSAADRDPPGVSALGDGWVGGVGVSGGRDGSAGTRNRSCSEHRGGRGGGAGRGMQRGAERYEKRRSGSECRRAVYVRRGASALGGHEIKPDAVAAPMDNLPLSKTKKSKQVEFVT